MISVSFVGAGRVGLTLSAFFLDKGIPVRWIMARSEESRKRATEVLRDKVPVLSSLTEIRPADIVFITVNDSSIKEVAHKVRSLLKSAVLVHTSGAHSSELIPGEGRASCHPLQSFANPSTAVKLVPETVFTLEGDERGIKLLKQLLERLNLQYTVIPTQCKPLYHASAVIASNYLVTLIYNALQTMKASGFPEDMGLKGLMKLIEGTLKNISTLGVPQALTGPIARGDWDTVKLHLEHLEKYPELKEFYLFMARKTAEMIGKKPPI